MKSKIFKITLTILLTAGITTLVSLATVDSGSRKVESIKISITDAENSLFLNSARVRTHLDAYGPIVGLYEDKLPLKELYDHLMLIPSVRKASVYPTLNGELNIVLTQKQPQVNTMLSSPFRVG